MNVLKNKIITIGSKDELQVEISHYGAAVTSIKLPRVKNFGDNVVLSLGDPSQVVSNGSYAGAVVGALSGRVANSVVYIDDKEYLLPPNEGKHFLHGGAEGISNKLWDVHSVDTNSATFSLNLKHLQDGLPGNRIFKAKYSVLGKMLAFHIEVQSDAVSPVNITNHMYFNLSGNFDGTALDPSLLINAQKVIINDDEHIPKKTIDVEGTHFNFVTQRKISHNLNMYSHSPQIKIAQGYNNCFLLNDGTFACKLFHEQSDRKLTITTSYPALVFYSGGFLDYQILLKAEGHATPSCGLAFEPQFRPDVQQFYSSDDNVVTPQKAFNQFINYDFSC